MPRRIEIELTSTRPDGTWTWRAAGAKEPKGVLDGALLYASAKAGDVVKAEAEFEIEGITIISVASPKSDGRNEPQRIEILGPARPEVPGVTTQLVGRQERRGSGRRREGDQRQPRGDRPSRDAGRGPDRRHGAAADRPERPARQGAASGDGRDRERGHRGPEEAHRDGASKREPRPARAEGRDSRDAARRDARRPVKAGGTARGASARQDDRGAKRLNPAHTHRQAILDALPPEQQPIAEQVLRGGIPAVRTALHLEREKAEAEGRPAPNTDQLIAMAEDLLPRLKAAEWRDRAEAAVKAADEISLRDLRSVVAGSDVARDEETRSLAATLREALERRLSTLLTQWSDEIAKQLDDGRVVRALRLSSRPPEPAARLGDDLSKRLVEAASEAMSPTASTDLWLALLDAAVASPVRRSITPVGLPAEPSPEVRQAALQQSSRIPALASMLGVSIPPPPVRKAAPARRSAPTQPRSGAVSAHPDGPAGHSDETSTPTASPGEAAS